MIYAWTDAGYADVSSNYRAYYKEILDSLKKQVAEGESDSPREAVQADSERAPHHLVLHDLPHSGAGEVSAEGAEPALLAENESASLNDGSAPSVAPEPPDYALVSGLDCTKATAIKIEKFVGLPRDASMKDGHPSGQSPKRGARKFAVSILSDIGTSEARSIIDSEIGAAAKERLKQAGEPPRVYKLIREDYPSSQLESSK